MTDCEINLEQWKQFQNTRDDALVFPPDKAWFENIHAPKGLMKLDVFCPICGKKINVTFRRPWSEKKNCIDYKSFNAKARFHHCNGVSVKLEIHPFDSRYHDEYLKKEEA
jgi:hypothetical protein